jgi:hypothetical protein
MVHAALGLPPCCAACREYDGADGVCRLLADPTLDNRRRLLTMPCDVERLLGHRFRASGADVARDALLAWLDPAWDPDDITLSYGKAPRDARLWLGSWPYLYLGRTAIRRLRRDAAREVGAPSPDAAAADVAEPAARLRVASALERVRRIDAVGFAMLVDLLHDRFDARAWGTALGAGPATVSDRKHLSVYRYGVYFHEILEALAPHEAAQALVSRRFSPGEPTEHAALLATREALAEPGLTLVGFRQLYRAGAHRSLELLASPEAFGPAAMAELGPTLRRVLRLDVNSSGG